MIRVVLDTNVVVSSLLSTGSPKAIFDLALKPAFTWYASEPILAEYERVLAYSRLQIDPKDARRAMAAIRRNVLLVKAKIVVRAASHEDDNRFLECAQASKAHYLVTGNIRHFPRNWKYTKIVPPKEFLILWQARSPID